MKQLEPKIDTSLIQTKLFNNNNSYEFFDVSLKNSKIFKNMKEQKNEVIGDKSISIKDIRILKYESCFDEKITDDIEFIKKILIKEKKLLNKNDYEISIFNKRKYPFIIGSGEEFNLLFKITKNAYINESINSTNKINKNNIKEQKKALYLLTQGESRSQSDVSKILINSMGDSIFTSSIFLNTKTLEDKDSKNYLNNKKKKSVVVPSNKTKSIAQIVQEPLMTFGNFAQRKISFNYKNDENINNERTKSNASKNSDVLNNTISKEIDMATATNDNIIENDQYL